MMANPGSPKRVWQAFRMAALPAAVLLATTLGGAADGENLVPNPSFELLDSTTAAPAEWTAWNTPNLAVYTLAAARTGVAAAAITDQCPRTSHGLRSPHVPVEAGTTYRASTWIHIEWVTSGAFALYLEFWQGGTRVWNRSVSTSDAPEWRKLALEGVAPAGATHATVLVYSTSATVGRAYFDDASLVRLD